MVAGLLNNANLPKCITIYGASTLAKFLAINILSGVVSSKVTPWRGKFTLLYGRKVACNISSSSSIMSRGGMRKEYSVEWWGESSLASRTISPFRYCMSLIPCNAVNSLIRRRSQPTASAVHTHKHIYREFLWRVADAQAHMYTCAGGYSCLYLRDPILTTLRELNFS